MSDFPYSAHPELRGLNPSEAWCFVDYANLLRSRYGRGRIPITAGTARFLKPPDVGEGPRCDHAHLVDGRVLLPDYRRTCASCAEHRPEVRDAVRRREARLAALPIIPHYFPRDQLLEALAREPDALLITHGTSVSGIDFYGLPEPELAQATRRIAVIGWSPFNGGYAGITVYTTGPAGLGSRLARFQYGSTQTG